MPHDPLSKIGIQMTRGIIDDYQKHADTYRQRLFTEMSDELSRLRRENDLLKEQLRDERARRL